ncbi:MAG TPA: protein-export chaperone SecB [Bacteroidota bacterium]|nr:protein-export chaperone SecB [Bacteroidota bacterium]
MSDPINKEILVVGLVLANSTFTRIPELVFGEQEENTISVDLKAQIDDNPKFMTHMHFEFLSKNKDIEQIKAVVDYAGIFENNGLTKEEKKNFAYINAPSIMFPFVRQHVFSMFSLASLKDIYLPLINFVKLAEEKGYLKEETAK